MKTLFKVVLFSLFIPLAACSQSNIIRSEVAARAANAADQALETAEWGVCEGSTMGAVNRRYNSEEKRSNYDKFCRRP